jgi:MerR family copper efflux transcriptional regulator
MNIGQIAKASGVSSKMIRHYEAIGLIQESRRTESNYRVYIEQDLHILRFIKSARSLGFSLEDIRRLLSLWQDKSRASADVKMLALSHIDSLNTKIQEITTMRDTLLTLANSCHGNDRPECPIIWGLSQKS